MATPIHAVAPRSRDRAARILVVEDEHLVALDLKQRLERMGYTVALAYTGEQAIEQTQASAFDLVLMDIKLAGPIDGIEAAHKIHAKLDVPIIYVTAYADNHTIERARTTEPYGYIVKPFHERELKASIEMALQHHEAARMRWEQHELQHFLADASSRMATSLDYRSVAEAAAELIVPHHADWCLIHLHEHNDPIAPFSYAYPPNGPALTNESVDRLIASVEHSAHPELIADVAGENGPTSLVCVPLVAIDRVLGALLLTTRPDRPRYDATSLGFAEGLGQRLGMALENALLFRRAEHAIAMRDDVLAIVSHDLRTPLGTIMIQAESLEGEVGRGKVCQSIVRAAQRMNRLIGDLLDASAINAGQLGLELGVHQVCDLVHDAADAFRSQAEGRSIELVEQVQNGPLQVRCDRDRMLQVLSNLISNAVKFTPSKGKVTIHVEVNGGHVHFEVADTGTGIAAEQLPHLFDRFWRAQGRKDGAGLGLFIVRGILAAHGSKIDVDSKPGVGSTFRFSLPLVAAG
jgi:signal transduction histidine kinase/CheY-like chemotaxis protein